MSNAIAVPIDKDAAVDQIAHWIDLITVALTTEASRAKMRAHIQHCLAAGTIPTMQVIEAARAGHEDADFALRQLVVEMLDRGELPNAALRAYAQEALLRPPSTYPRGRNPVDTWLRDVAILMLVNLAVEFWKPNLPKTRNKASSRPSACSLVSEALNRRRHPLGERQVERIARSPSELVQKVSASIPPI